MSERKQVTAFELIDHGIEHSQYFQGCGISFTSFDDVATGIGDNPAEAIEDALESLAQQGWDVDTLDKSILEDEGWKSFPITPSVFEEYPFDYDDERNDPCEVYYHVSIRVK